MKAVLTGEPRLTGADQSENRSGSSASCCEASRPGGTSWVGALVESSRQLARASASSSTPCADADLMDPSSLEVVAACGWEPWKSPHAPLDGPQREGCYKSPDWMPACSKLRRRVPSARYTRL